MVLTNVVLAGMPNAGSIPTLSDVLSAGHDANGGDIVGVGILSANEFRTPSGAWLGDWSDERVQFRSAHENSSHIGLALGAGWSGGGGPGGNPVAVILAEDNNGYTDSNLSLYIAPESEFGSLYLNGGGPGGENGVLVINAAKHVLIGTDIDDNSETSLQVSGAISLLNIGQIKNLLDPTDAQDAATKSYVDSSLSGMPSVSTTNLTVIGSLSVTNAVATNVISGVTTITCIPEQGDLGMGSYTNLPGL